MVAAGAVFRPSGSSTIPRGTVPSSRSCSAIRKAMLVITDDERRREVLAGDPQHCLLQHAALGDERQQLFRRSARDSGQRSRPSTTRQDDGMHGIAHASLSVASGRSWRKRTDRAGRDILRSYWCRIYAQLGPYGGSRGRNAGKFVDFAFPRLSVQTLRVTHFARLQVGVDIDLVEDFRRDRPHSCRGRPGRGDERRQHQKAGAGEQLGGLTDPADVLD